MNRLPQHWLRVGLSGVLLANIVAAHGDVLHTPWREIDRIESRIALPEDRFATDVARDGDTLIVGAGETGGQGSAYVFELVDGVWVERQELLASDGFPNDDHRFGNSVGIDGDTIVVAAFSADIGPNDQQGAVYVFRKPGNVWIETQKLLASDGAEQDLFGAPLDFEDGTLMAAATRADVGPNESQGAVYVFEEIAGIWREAQKVVLSTGQENDLLGSDIEIDGDLALVGAHSATVLAINQGAAYFLHKVGGLWVEGERIVASDAGESHGFGSSVGLDGDLVVVGANAREQSYVFRNVAGVWTEEQILTSPDAGQTDFGTASEVLAGRVVASGEFDTEGISQGALYSFRFLDGTWTQEQRVTASDGHALNNFGQRFQLLGDEMYVAASAASPAGAVYVYERTPLFADGFESGDTLAWSQTVP